MSNKNVIDIEGRIPTLKDRRKQRANRRLIFYISFFFVLMTVVTYFQTSFSHVKEVEVNGNSYVATEWIVDNSQLLSEISMWRINEDVIMSNLLAHPEISTIAVTRQWPNVVSIDVKEYERVAYIAEETVYIPLLETGTLLHSSDVHVPYDAPILVGFDGEEERSLFAKELLEVPLSIRQRISEVFLTPTDNDPLRLMIYMNDGFVVNSTIRRFSERITPYPSIVEHLDPSVEGIIHMRMNPYFESFENEEEEDSEGEG